MWFVLQVLVIVIFILCMVFSPQLSRCPRVRCYNEVIRDPDNLNPNSYAYFIFLNYTDTGRTVDCGRRFCTYNETKWCIGCQMCPKNFSVCRQHEYDSLYFPPACANALACGSVLWVGLFVGMLIYILTLCIIYVATAYHKYACPNGKVDRNEESRKLLQAV
jgi:hypothetical protein